MAEAFKIRKHVRETERRYAGCIYSGYVCETAISLCASVLVTGTLSRAVSTVITGDAKEEIYRSVFLFFALSLLTILLEVLNRFLAFFRTKKTGCAIEDDILAYYYAIPYTDEINKDEVQANMSKTVQEFNSMYYTYKTSIFRITSTIFFSCAYALSIHWLSLAGMVFLGVLTVLVYREDLQEVSKLREKIGEKRNLLYRNLWESVENLEIERFLNERKIFEKYQENSRGLVDYRVKSNKRQVKGQLYSELGTGCLVILIAVLYAALNGFSVNGMENLLTLALIAPKTAHAFFEIPNAILSKYNLKGMEQFIDGFFCFEQKEKDKEEKPTEEVHAALSLVIESGALGYQKSGQILDNINLVFRPGRLTAVCGENGAGKSTLLKAIAGIHPFETGRAYLEDDSHREQAIDKKSICYFEQIPTVFPGTLQENIVLGDAFDEEKYKNAVRMSGLEDFSHVDLVSEGNVSEGERQKIAFARLFYHRYRVLLLDECTARMDEDTERKIVASLKKYIADGRVIAVAVCHRESFLQYCDEKVVLSRRRAGNGQIG